MANETGGRIAFKYYQPAEKSDTPGVIEDPREDDQAKAVAIPLFVFVLICIIIFIIKIKYSKRKIGTISFNNLKAKLEPSENPLNIRFKCLLGKGSFGVVWKASLNGDIVAVKMCPIEKRERWEKERDILLGLERHPNIIEMIDSEVRKLKDEIALIIIIEFVDCGDLRTFLMENHLNIDKALFFLKSLFDGLQFLHSAKDQANKRKKRIAHRDIKSSNILVSSYKGCVIADYGLALCLNEGESLSLEVALAKVGTARYMAPEKLKGAVDARNIWRSLCLIDVYAASIVIYEIMTRCNFEFNSFKEGSYIVPAYELPFGDQVGTQPSNDDMKRLIVHHNFRPIIPQEWSYNEAVKQVSDLIRKCWDKNPNVRRSAEEVFQEIKVIFVNHELEASCHSFDDDVGQYKESDNLIYRNEIIIEINENKAKNNIVLNNIDKSTYL